MTPQEKEQKKIEHLCEMFPQVECDMVKAIYHECKRNFNETVMQLSSIFGSVEPQPTM
jgi:hypothetical protein